MLQTQSLVMRRIRAAQALLSKRLYLSVWFPHGPLAFLLFLGGYLLLDISFAGHWKEYAQLLLSNQQGLSPSLLPPLLIGGGMVVMALGLLFRSRLAWVITLLLVVVGLISVSLGSTGHQLLGYFIFMLVVLFVFWKNFDRSSVAASTLFALTAIVMLLGYSTFGAYYLGQGFDPKITDLVTAFYWSMVTMSTVGYGDISPVTHEGMLFTSSVIILGVAVFATALTAVIGPLVSNSLSRIVHQKGAKMKRENHFVVIGDTPLAANTAKAMKKRGQAVTRLFREEPDEEKSQAYDCVVGDPSRADVLQEAGVEKAEAVLAMLADDSENAFVVLAVRDLAPSVETIVAVNSGDNLDRVKLAQPHAIITPQLLGGELAAMMLAGEEITSEFVMEHVFKRISETA